MSEEFEDVKGRRNQKSKKDRQQNGQKQKHKQCPIKQYTEN